MKPKLLFFAACLVFLSGLLISEPGFTYYYPPNNTPPGPPPNYNQVDTVYFLGTPEIPLPPPDSGGIYIYYDQGIWNVANHIYSKGNSFEQFHCCILAVLSQPPTLGVNVFAEQFELEVPGGLADTSKCNCLRQNDRWGWIPWGDSLYEIWWDVSTRDWDSKCGGDPNDFMKFQITGCAVDFNLWSSGHGTTFGPDQIFLGANKTPLSTVPGFTDTYPGVNDPYQSQAGSDPENDPNITIFTWKSNTLRSYNKFGLIHFTDWYWCDLAWNYGERYAGSFAYEGDGVEFSTSSLCPPNHDPSIFITPDTSVLLCSGDSVRIWIFASDPDAGDLITVEKIYGVGYYPDTTDLTPISDEFYFHPDTSGVYMFIFRVIDDQGATDEDTTNITVNFNQPPQLTCPEDGSVNAEETFVSSNFSVVDPDGDSAPVTFLDINPSATNNPTIEDSHVEWVTTLSEDGDYIIRLVATDPCGLKDTCQFTVSVLNEPTGDFSCPEDDSAHAGETFVSTDFSVTYPECDPSSVALLDINPSATNEPTVVGNHVEWVTTCAEDGDYVIRLMTDENCSIQDTCEFTVTVYNRPPELTCPDDGSVCGGHTFVSSDFLATDPDGDSVSVIILDVRPPFTVYPGNKPVIVESHVEWPARGAPSDDYTFRLVATDPCGLKDTCEFTVSVLPGFTISATPDTQYAIGGQAVGYVIRLTSFAGFEDACTLFVSGLPSPPENGIFDKAVLTPTDSTSLHVYTTAKTDTGWYTLTLTAQSMSGPKPACNEQSIQVYLNVQLSSDAEDGADNPNAPKSFALFQNQPNPFNPKTHISYYLPEDCQVRLTIYNVLGQRVKTLFDGHQQAGMQTLIWDGRDKDGAHLSSGIYFYRLQADDFHQTKKMTLMK